MTGAHVTVTNKDAVIEGDSVKTTDATFAATGNVNDALGGDASTLVENLKMEDGATITMQEGFVQGETIATVDAEGNATVKSSKPSTTMQTSLELATAAPLAINRILMNDIRKRMGDLRTNPGEYGAWARYEGGKLKGDGGLTNDFNTFQVGADKALGDSFRLGAAFSYTRGDVKHASGDAEADTFMFSGYGIWMGQNGMFADVIARVGNTDTNMTVKGFDTSIDTLTYSLSGEFGWRFDLCKSFYVEPQVELTYTYIDGDEFSISSAKFDVDSMNSLIGRAGVLAGWKFSENGDVYARASVLQEFAGDAEITGKNGSRASYKQDGEDTWFEYGIGANVKLTDSAYLWADVERTEGADIEEEWRGTVGVRFSF